MVKTFKDFLENESPEAYSWTIPTGKAYDLRRVRSIVQEALSGVNDPFANLAAHDHLIANLDKAGLFAYGIRLDVCRRGAQGEDQWYRHYRERYHDILRDIVERIDGKEPRV